MDTNEIVQLDPEAQDSAKEYARIRRRLYLLDLVLGVLYLLLWIVSGAALWVAGTLSTLQIGWVGELALMAFIIFLPWTVLFLPLDFYSGYVLPHRYGLSTQTISGWLSDLAKTFILSIALGAPLMIGLYALMRAFPETWWLWAVVGYTLVGAVLTALTPILLMPIFYKLKPLEEAYHELAQRLLLLAEHAKVRAEGVYSFDMSRRTKAANAALIGLGKTRRIILGDTLLESFSEEEIESVLAHELGHLVHHDIPLSLIFQSVLNILVFYLGSVVLSWTAMEQGVDQIYNPAILPVLVLVFTIIGFLTLPIGNAFSRWRERLADEYALETTQNPSAFMSAMTRLANQNLAEVRPERWVVLLLHSHPPLEDRIAQAECFRSVSSQE